MRELVAGLWYWQAPHPDWTPEERWPQEVSSYAIDDEARLLLIDPLAVPSEILDLAAAREPAIVLTVVGQRSYGMPSSDFSDVRPRSTSTRGSATWTQPDGCGSSVPNRTFRTTLDARGY